MPKLVVNGAVLKCSEGLAPSSLTVPPSAGAGVDEKPAATVMDNIAVVNLAPFGMCKSLANPQVTAATAAALGALTPQPCMPIVPAPWSPGSGFVTLDGKLALTSNSTCSCVWAGIIEVTQPGAEIETD